MYYIHNNKIDKKNTNIQNFVKYIKIGFNKTNNKSLNFAIFSLHYKRLEVCLKNPNENKMNS